MLQYYNQIRKDLSDWNYVDLTLEAYDKLEKLLKDSLELYYENPMITQGNLIKSRLILLALAQTLNDDDIYNILIRKLKSIYAYMIDKLDMENIDQIKLIIQAIPMLRDSIRQWHSIGHDNGIHPETSIVNSIRIEA
jgi:flagellin-specific chaperone FliS